ncbi:hypothetical protein V3851_09475 [Paenibacillus sp. M1]|uniref:Uncharacterized protein n=1 Tax=Paenibacillus haidiansis TaxID=1574488 RepID=A0ABU7VS72_9BACL
MKTVSRLPFLFIITGIAGFVLFHATSILSLTGWLGEGIRGPTGWFQVHLFVLGWATMLAMGSVYQLINVILQSEIYSERLGYIHYFLFTIGLFGLLLGFIQGDILWIAGFATLAFTGILLFVWNMAVTLFRAAKWDGITLSTACAVLYLLLTGLSGMSMGIDFGTGWLGGLHENLFGTHIWLGTLGWFGMLITGLSYKLLPMFYLSHDYDTRLQYIVLGLWNTGVLLGAVSFLFGTGLWVTWTALAVMAAALIVYNIHAMQIRSKRHKRSPGAGIGWTTYGNLLLAVFALALLVKLAGSPGLLVETRMVMLAGWAYLNGWVSFMILSYASKIVPFLWWTHKYGKQVGKPGTPMMANLLDEKKANLGLGLIACANLAVLAGIALDSQLVIAISGIAYSIVSLAYISLIALVFSK